jgi:peptidoglycan/xylan/chitin deacetylase (PgdA/CDA1 family)
MTPRRSCILTYHSLDDTGSVISTPPATFREQMNWLASKGIPVVPLEQICDKPGAVAITFDDGFRNFFDDALPVLQQHRFPATVFVVTRFCGAWNDWPSQPRTNGIPKLELMSWEQVRQVARTGIGIGCHTGTHPYLSRLSAGDLEQELHSSRAEIEQRIGLPVNTFAYPYGDAPVAVREAAGRAYKLAVTTRLAFVKPGANALDLPRLDTYYLRDLRWFRGLSKAYGAAYLALRGWARGVRQMV